MTATEIKTKREKLGLSQYQLAAKLRVTVYAVSAWEQGKRNISEPTAKLLRGLR